MINYTRYYFLLIVVLLHVTFIIPYVGIGVTNYSFRLTSTYFIANIHPVAILSLISGYLFYSSIKVATFKEFMSSGVYAMRIKRILTPYLIWKCVILAIYAIGYLIYLYFHTTETKVLYKMSARPILECFFISDGNFATDIMYSMHLWYIHHLIIVFTITPIVFLSKIPKYVFPLFVLIIYTIFPEIESVIHIRFLMFFTMGALLGLNKEIAVKLFKWLLNKYVIIGALVFALALYITLQTFIPGKSPFDFDFWFLTHSTSNNIFSIFIPVIFFMIFQFIIHHIGIKKDLQYEKGQHFFLYLLHPYLVLYILKGVYEIPGVKELWRYNLFLIFLLPVITIITVFLNKQISSFIERKSPTLYKKLT